MYCKIIKVDSNWLEQDIYLINHKLNSVPCYTLYWIHFIIMITIHLVCYLTLKQPTCMIFSIFNNPISGQTGKIWNTLYKLGMYILQLTVLYKYIQSQRNH